MKATLIFALATGQAIAFSPVVPHRSNSRLGMTSSSLPEDAGMASYPDQERRSLLNLIVLGSAAASVSGIALPFLAFFVPPGSGGVRNAPITARDAVGTEVMEKAYLESKPSGDCSLVQGLQGDPTYLIVKDDHTLERYALNAGTFLFPLFIGNVLPFLLLFSSSFPLPCFFFLCFTF